MGWLIAVLIVLAMVGLLAVLVPALFGPVLAGIAPILLLATLLGIGAVWWRHRDQRIDPEPKADQPDASMEDERP